MQKKVHKIAQIAAKLINILLIAGICLFNTTLSFAEFAVDASKMFSASVTIEGAPTDLDFDAMSDSWETQYGLNPNDPDDADTDKDSDGITNLEEYRQGSDPTISESQMQVSITASPASGEQPLDVTLTAEFPAGEATKEKVKPKDDIVKYEWDFDGNGTYDYSSTEPSVNYKFTTAGDNDIKLRITNNKGQAAVADETISISKKSSVPEAIIIEPTALETPVPYTSQFFGAKNTGIGAYQWDLDGNGEYDFTSTKSASISYTYKDVKRHSFYANFKITGNSGLSDISKSWIDIDSSSWYDPTTDQGLARPTIVFPNGYVITNKKAGEEIPLSGYGVPVAGNDHGYAKKLEWDFEGDGIYDWVSTLTNNSWTSNTIENAKGNANVAYAYGTPGIYRPTLRVTTDANVTATDHILVIVKDSGKTPPNAKAEAEYNKLKKQTSVDAALPVEVTFSHNGSSSNSKKFEWDFNGDKRIDYVTTKNNDSLTYIYTKPGYYMACLRVTDKDNLTDTAYIPVFVYIDESKTTHASVIIEPEKSKKVAGNKVTLTCNVFPDNVTAGDIVFQYSEDGKQWLDIAGEVTSKASYMIRWNTKTVFDGNYFVRAVVKGEIPENCLFIPITVANGFNPDDVDIYEDDSTGTYTKKININPDKDNEIVLSDGTKIEIPIGAIENNGTTPRFTIETSAETAGVGNAIDITINGPSTFNQDITIIMPYPDADNDGIVDGTNINENDLMLMWQNAQGVWEPLYDCVIYPDENYVAAKTNHLSLLGIGFLGGGAAAAGGSGGGSVFGQGVASYCFIATAAYGSYDCKDVMILREFRDNFLLTNPLGEKFVKYYYKHSPAIANYIKDKPILRSVTRLLLKPLVKISEASLRKLAR